MSGPHPFSTISEKRSMASFINPSLQSPSMMVSAKPIDDGSVCNYVRSTPLLHHFRKEVYGLFHQPLFAKPIDDGIVCNYVRSTTPSPSPPFLPPFPKRGLWPLSSTPLPSTPLCKAHR
eukprot:TRINITY_DN13654_c0_g1_i9.p2 TRINITY_DN13654_c0_g1~~TRINITY_DN13654_c0_g1_i9.p2  ORF type:complete len:119 (-),score=13.61 TRINITY_DN13654_c0_g1_i9:146-502(-)